MADFEITPGHVKALGGSTVQWGTAGTGIVAGEGLYEDPADGKLKKAICTNFFGLKGIAIAAASAGQPIPYVSAGPVQVDALAPLGFTSEIVLVSNTAGLFRPASDLAPGDVVTIAGFLDATGRNLVVTISRQADGPYAD